MTRQAVSDRVRHRRVLALRTGSGRLVYPAFQFDRGRVVNGVADVLGAVQPDDADSWTVASWFVTADSALDGRRPIDGLRDGDVDGVMAAARDVAAGLAA